MMRRLSTIAARGRPERPSLCAGAVRLATAVLAAGLLGGCIPVMLAGLVLGGGDRSPSTNSGPFSGASHPVQNAAPSTPGSEALSSVVDKPILDSCKAKLPDPPEPLPTTGCSVRPSCLAGMSSPMRLRVCALPSQASEPVGTTPAAAPAES